MTQLDEAQHGLQRGDVVLGDRRFPRVSWTDRTGSHEALIDRRVVVGASDQADLVISDPTISRVHAELFPKADGMWIRDLNSRNGTTVNGAGIQETCLKLSGEVQVGMTKLRIDFEGGIVGRVELWPGFQFHDMVGRSSAMRELFALLDRVASTDTSVLINGETGTGKELVAKSLHDLSPRREAPFIVVDCAALPENLLEAELFGHTKGAFTGAAQAREGAFEAADGGTVFLDEIGELPIGMQPKLLRVLEQRQVRRIGETGYRPVNVRFICATHRDLLAMVSKREFREDLYFRICVIPVTVPPLRERREDIELLVKHFGFGETLDEEFVEQLAHMPWRGNVRELRNYIERAVALGSDRSPLRRSFADHEAPSVSRLPGQVTVDRPRGTAPPPGASGNGRGAPSKLSEKLHHLPKLGGSGGRRDEMTAATANVEGEVGTGPTDNPVPFEGDFKVFRERWIEFGEKEYLRRMLERHRWNVPEVAKEACVARTYIYRLMRKYDL